MPRLKFPANSAVLITAAASGMGAACAKMLTQSGVWVFAGIRSQASAAQVQQELGDKGSVLFLDVTNPQSITSAIDQLREGLEVRQLSLYGVINNAAQEYMGPFELLPLDWVRHEMEVGYFGYLSVIKACLPLLRQSQGRIINFSSINGRCVFPVVGSGCATKYAIEALSDALRLELAPWHIKVVIIEPAIVATPLWRKTQATFEKLPDFTSPEQLALYYPDWSAAVHKAAQDTETYSATAMSVEKAANTVLRAMSTPRPKARYLLGSTARLIAIARWLCPDSLFDRLAQTIFH